MSREYTNNVPFVREFFEKSFHGIVIQNTVIIGLYYVVAFSVLCVLLQTTHV